MKLFYGAASPYSRKVRVVALELGLDLELVSTNAMAIDNGFGVINPVNRVPALMLDTGEVIFDSPLICEYLDVTFGPRLLASFGKSRWDTLRNQALGDGLMDAAVPRRHETLRPVEQQSASRLDLYKRSIDQIIATLEAKLPELSRADIGAISIACSLSYLDFRFPQDDWRAKHPALAIWLDDFSARESMQSTPFL